MVALILTILGIIITIIFGIGLIRIKKYPGKIILIKEMNLSLLTFK